MSNRIDYENLIIDLYLIKKMNRRGYLYIVKILYLYEESLMKQSLIGSTYKMYKYHFGPYNAMIKPNVEALARRGFLSSKVQYFPRQDEFHTLYEKNEQTETFLKEIDELIQENAPVFEPLDGLIEQFKGYTGKRLMNYIYSLEKTGVKQTRMTDYKLNDIVVDPCLLKRPKFAFKLDEDWYDTIEVLLDPSYKTRLEQAIQDAREGRVVFN